MTNFVKDMFNTSGEYITYGADHKFVARFKYQDRKSTRLNSSH